MTMENSTLNNSILLETFYSCVLNTSNEMFISKIMNCLIPFISCYRDIFTEDYQDTFINIIKHCIQIDSLKQQLLTKINMITPCPLQSDIQLQTLFSSN